MAHQLRQEWQFTYTAEQLLKGVFAKIKWHKGRFEFWCDKQQEIKHTIGEKGIVIDEGAGGEGYMSSNLRGPTARIDTKLQDHLRQATAKLMHHREKVTEYEGWKEILAAQKPITPYPLQHHDWMFFFSETSEKEEDTDDDFAPEDY